MRRPFFAGLFPLPALGTGLWLTLAGLVLGALNLAFLAAIWPRIPAAKSALLLLEWLLVLALLPQLLGWAWRWLRAYAGPGWVRLLGIIMFLTGACGMLILWFITLVGVPFVLV